MSDVTNNSGSSGAAAGAARARKRPRFFLLKAALLYYIGLIAQFLTVPAVLAGYGIWPLLLTLIVLAAFWYLLHAARLRDAGRSLAPAQGVLAIYALAVGLLILIGAFFMEDAEALDTAQSVLLLRQIFTFSRGVGDPLTYIGLIAGAALLLPFVFSIWAARQEKRA